MSHLRIEEVFEPGRWLTFAGDGRTVSTELAVSIDTEPTPLGQVKSCVHMTGSDKAADHRARCKIPSLDLSNFEELAFWVRSDKVADGSEDKPFLIELRLSSDTVSTESPANKFARYFPVSASRTWELVHFSLVDLNPSVRAAMTYLHLRVLPTPTMAAFDYKFADLIALKRQVVTDVEEALIYLLDNALQIDGSTIPAVVRTPGMSVPVKNSLFLIATLDVQRNKSKDISHTVKRDYREDGYAVGPRQQAYNVLIQIECLPKDASHQRQMMDFVIQTLCLRDYIPIAGKLMPIEFVGGPYKERWASTSPYMQGLLFNIQTFLPAGAINWVQPVSAVKLEVDMLSLGKSVGFLTPAGKE